VGIEHIKELVDQSVKNVQKDNPDLLKQERIKLISKLCVYKLSWESLSEPKER